MTEIQSGFFVFLLVSSILMPLISAAMLLPLRTRRFSLSALAPFSALPALVLSLWSFVNPHRFLDFPFIMTGITLGIDPLSRTFLFFTSLLWAVSGIYAGSFLAADGRRHRFFFFFLLSLSGNIGLVLSQNMTGFYLFFALMTLPAYGLVIHDRNPEAWFAGRVYIVMAIIGEALVLEALIHAASVSGGNLSFQQIPAAIGASESRDLIIALVLSGFGIKAGLVPFHFWLPSAYRAAPIPAAVVLSGAMSKAGVLAWLRFLPLGVVPLPEWGYLCMSVGLGASFYGVIIGLTQDEPKTVLAYSSISQMGFIALGIGFGFARPESWPFALTAILIAAYHHALAKGALFLGLGIANRKFAAAGLLLPALALAGAPFTSGAAAKTSLKAVLSGASVSWWPGTLEWMLYAAAIGTTLLMSRLLFLVIGGRYAGERQEIKKGLWMPWLILLMFVAAGAWMVPVENIRHAAREVLSGRAFVRALWPILAGVFFSGLVWQRTKKRKPGKRLSVPPGDILVLMVRAFKSREVVVKWTGIVLQQQRDHFVALFTALSPVFVPGFDIDRMDRSFARWLAAGLLFIGLALALYIAMAW